MCAGPGGPGGGPGGDAKFTVEDGCIKGEGVPSTLGINTFLATDPAVAAKCQNPGGTNEFTVIEMNGRTVIRLNGFEVSDTNAK